MQAERRRYHGLDSLRGLCALCVVLFHFNSIGWLTGNAFARGTYLFVDFFFVLSGFVITHSYRTKLAEGFGLVRFMLLRLGRIYPLHVVLLVLFFAWQLWLRHTGAVDPAPFSGLMSPHSFLRCALLIQWLAPIKIEVNVPAWSVAVELWTYGLFALAFRLRSDRALVAIALVAAAGSAAALAFLQPDRIDPAGAYSLLRCVYGFGVGSALAMVMRSRGGRRLPAATAVELLTAAAIVLFVIVSARGWMTMAAPLLFAAAVAVFAHEGGVVSRMLLRRPFRVLGALSYAIYIGHYFVIRVVAEPLVAHFEAPGHAILCIRDPVCRSAANPLLADLATILLLAAVIAFAAILHRAIERPCERWVRRAVLAREPDRAREKAAQADAAF